MKQKLAILFLILFTLSASAFGKQGAESKAPVLAGPVGLPTNTAGAGIDDRYTDLDIANCLIAETPAAGDEDSDAEYEQLKSCLEH